MHEADEPTGEPERVKVCPSCLAVVGYEARFCEACGKPLAEKIEIPSAPPEKGDAAAVVRHVAEFESRDASKLARELYKRHLALISQVRAKVGRLGQETSEIGDRMRLIGSRRFSAERTHDLQEALEDLEAVGDRWEDIQHEFNKESEELDDEILDRAAELELDVELPPQLRLRVGEELESLTTDMQALSDSLVRLGTAGQRMLQAPTGQYFGAASGGANPLVFWILASAACGISFWLARRFGLDVKNALRVVVAPWVAFVGILAAITAMRRR